MDKEVCNLLTEWGLEAYIEVFKEKCINTMAMALLDAPEIKELIPIIGHRVLFARSLKAWQKTMHPAATSTPSHEEDVEIVCPQPQQPQVDFSFSFSDLLNNEVPSQPSSSRMLVDTVSPITLTIPTVEISPNISNLKELLESTLEGKGLLTLDKANPLENTARLRLVRIICTHILKNHPEKNIKAETYALWTHEIVNLFPQENRSVYFHTKFVDSSRGIANRLGGKLPDQIHNLKRKYRETGIIAKRSKSSSTSPRQPASPISPSLCRLPEEDPHKEEDEESVQENLQWLQNSSDPWITVEQKWEETTWPRLRQSKDKTISEYFHDYPALQKPLGHILLVKDFNTVYADHTTGLTDNFPPLKKKLFEVASKRVSNKDKYLQNLLALENAPEETTNIASFLLIPSLLGVSTVRLKSTTKKSWRPSKAEVRDGFITHVGSDAEMREVLCERRKKFSEFGLTLQPFIVIVGPSLRDIVSYFVIVNDTTFMLHNIMTAVDACFKIIWIVNAQYSVECHCTWMFIQRALYKWKTRFDRESTAANTLIGDLCIRDL